MNKRVGIIVPTIGSEYLEACLDSIKCQTYDNIIVYLVVDGKKYGEKVEDLFYSCYNMNGFELIILPENVGNWNDKNFYSHRIYAGISQLINCDYVVYLDEDNYFEPNHIESLVNIIENNNLDWTYSYRKIIDKEGNYICNDEFESVGKYQKILDYKLVDTSSYMIKQEIAIRIASAWYGEWGIDRQVYSILEQNFPNFDSTKNYTLNYRIGSSETSPKKEFFLQGNSRLKGEIPIQNNNIKEFVYKIG